MYFGNLNQLLKIMVTVKQIQQLNQICHNPQWSYSQESADSDVTSIDKSVKLADAYRAYGEYCSLFGITPSEEGFKVWYGENIDVLADDRKCH